jgi:low temperature requirement protein LtrA
VVALGIPEMFASIDHGDTLDIGVMVAGYVVMRVPLIALWAQVARHDPARAPSARAYMVTTVVSQVGWIVLALSELPVVTTFLILFPLLAIELAGPYVAERRAGTPWHPHHIAERYGLLVIITLGEVILGTVAAINAVVHGETGWSVDAAVLAIAGVGLTFACWWMYFAVPWAEPLVRHRERGFRFAHGHLLIFAPLAAMGAGLHVAAYGLEGEAKIGATAIVLSVVIPVAIFALAFYAVYSALFRTGDAFHLMLLALMGALLAAAVVLASAGVSVSVCLIVVALAPVATVIGYETIGHQHMADATRRL